MDEILREQKPSSECSVFISLNYLLTVFVDSENQHISSLKKKISFSVQNKFTLEAILEHFLSLKISKAIHDDEDLIPSALEELEFMQIFSTKEGVEFLRGLWEFSVDAPVELHCIIIQVAWLIIYWSAKNPLYYEKFPKDQVFYSYGDSDPGLILTKFIKLCSLEEFTPGMINCLFDISTGHFEVYSRLNENKKRENYDFWNDIGRTNTRSSVIKYPEVFDCIVYTACAKKDDLENAVKIIEHITYLLISFESNICIFAMDARFQLLMLRLLDNCTCVFRNCGESSSIITEEIDNIESEDEGFDVFKAPRWVLRVLIKDQPIESMQTRILWLVVHNLVLFLLYHFKKGGDLEQSFHTMCEFLRDGRESSSECLVVVRVVLFSLVTKIFYSLSTMRRNYFSQDWKNFFSLGKTLEYFLFYMPDVCKKSEKFAIHLDSKGRAEDLGLVQRFLELLEGINDEEILLSLHQPLRMSPLNVSERKELQTLARKIVQERKFFKLVFVLLKKIHLGNSPLTERVVDLLEKRYCERSSPDLNCPLIEMNISEELLKCQRRASQNFEPPFLYSFQAWIPSKAYETSKFRFASYFHEVMVDIERFQMDSDEDGSIGVSFTENSPTDFESENSKTTQRTAYNFDQDVIGQDSSFCINSNADFTKSPNSDNGSPSSKSTKTDLSAREISIARIMSTFALQDDTIKLSSNSSALMLNVFNHSPSPSASSRNRLNNSLKKQAISRHVSNNSSFREATDSTLTFRHVHRPLKHSFIESWSIRNVERIYETLWIANTSNEEKSSIIDEINTKITKRISTKISGLINRANSVSCEFAEESTVAENNYHPVRNNIERLPKIVMEMMNKNLREIYFESDNARKEFVRLCIVQNKNIDIVRTDSRIRKNVVKLSKGKRRKEINYEYSKMCTVCNKKFSLLIVKKICNLCCEAVCKKCSDRKIVLPEFNQKSAYIKFRVCIKCFESRESSINLNKTVKFCQSLTYRGKIENELHGLEEISPKRVQLKIKIESFS